MTAANAERGRRLMEEHGGERDALKATHPDQGGDRRDFEDVQAAREQERNSEEGRALAEAIRSQYTRYVVFHRDYADAEADTLTLWTMHTHAFDAAECTPYLAVMAPTPEAGKSKIIEVAQYLVRNGEVVHDPSPSSLFRMIDADLPTLFIDEIDMLYQSKAVKTVLNAGYRIGAYVTRTEKVGDERMPLRFSVFCPKMFAGIAGKRLPIKGATLSRCIEIPMQRKAPDEHAERFAHRRARIESEPLYSLLVDWAREAVDRLSVAEPHLPHGLTDRQAEVWEPLFSIAHMLGGDWPNRVASAAMTLSERAVAQPDEGTQIIADVRAVWADFDGDRAHTAVLAEMRNALEDKRYHGTLTAHELSMWLGRFEIHPLKNAFRQGGKLRRGYERSAFADAFERYPS